MIPSYAVGFVAQRARLHFHREIVMRDVFVAQDFGSLPDDGVYAVYRDQDFAVD